MAKSIEFGACFFDDKETPQSGWVSINGSEVARISKISELRSDVVWVTNIPFKTYRDMNLDSIGNIFDEQFFRTSITQLLKELSLENSIKQACVELSKIFTRVATFGSDKFNLSTEELSYRYFTTVNTALLPSVSRSAPNHSCSIEIMDAIKQSTQPLQVMTAKAPKGSVAVNFLFPRSAYYKFIFSLDYPLSSEWAVIPKLNNTATFGYESGAVIKGTKAIIAKYIKLSETHAAFFRVTVISQDGTYSDYQMFGASGAFNKKRASVRLWATLPEIVHLSTYSKVKVEGGFCTPHSKLSLADKLNFPDREFSYSRGLFAENLFAGLSTPLYGNELKASALGAYLRCYDRLACAKAAEGFNKAGFVVGSFGLGRVTVFVSQSEREQVTAVSLKLGLVPPSFEVSNE